MKSCTFGRTRGGPLLQEDRAFLEWNRRERERKRQTTKVPLFTLATGSKFLFITAPTSLGCLKRLFLPSLLSLSLDLASEIKYG